MFPTEGPEDCYAKDLAQNYNVFTVQEHIFAIMFCHQCYKYELKNVILLLAEMAASLSLNGFYSHARTFKYCQCNAQITVLKLSIVMLKS